MRGIATPKPRSLRYLGLQVGITRERRAAVYAEIEDLSTPTWSYYLRVVISTTIATYGLLANSTSVVIGAMLVAPLMGPIFGVALGLSTGDRRLLRAAGTSELFGALLAFAIAAVVGLAPLNLGLGSEIIARTQPTLYDLVVALASGVAGAYATVDEKLSASLPGVAISTALVPPLATAGLCLSAGRYDWASGALLLFVANFVAIQIAAAGVFLVFGLPTVRFAERMAPGLFVRRFGISLIVLVAVGAFMTRTLIHLVAEHRLSGDIADQLRAQVRSSAGASLTDFQITPDGERLDVIATVMTPFEFTPAQVAKIESVLRTNVEPHIHLVLRSLISKDFDSQGPVYLPQLAREQRESVEKQTNLLRATRETLETQLRSVAGAHLVEVRVEGQEQPPRLLAVVRSPTAITPTEVARIQKGVRDAIDEPVELVVRTVLTRDADAERFVYDREERVASIPAEALEQRRAIESRLRAAFEFRSGVSLGEVRQLESDGRRLVLVQVRAPVEIEPREVRSIESDLREHVAKNIDLVVRYSLGADVTASGLVNLDDDRPAALPALWRADDVRRLLRFESGSAQVSARARDLLDQLAQELRTRQGWTLFVEGFSDPRGNELANRRLSLARAIAVRDALVARGLDGDSIRVSGNGSMHALDAPDGLAANRRVELRVAFPAEADAAAAN